MRFIKNMKILALSSLMTIGLCSTIYAGEWREDETGWWYQNTDGSYLSSGWNWIDGKCYYFDDLGYCLQNTTAPDGNVVDKTGAWIKDGVVQTQPYELKIGTLTTKIPNGYTYTLDSDNQGILLEADKKGIQLIVVESDDIEDIKQYHGEEGLDRVSDLSITGVLESIATNIVLLDRSTRDYNDTHWNYYKYNVTSLTTGAVVDIEVYTSYVGNEIRMIFCIGGASREFMSNDDYVRDFIK